MIRKLLKKRIHIKPLSGDVFADVTLTLELNTIENFIDDFKRYGLLVALENFAYLMRTTP